MTILPAMIAILLLLAAGTCRAEDPLESLNTVEETLSQLAQHRAHHSSPQSNMPPRSEENSPLPFPGSAGRLQEPPAGAAPVEAQPACCDEEPPSPGDAPAEKR